MPFPPTPFLATTAQVTPLPGRSFLAPNEHNLGDLAPHLPARGNLVAVGTERLFMTAGMYGDRIAQVAGVDIDPRVYLYNMCNIAMLNVSNSREDYLALRRQVANGDASALKDRLERQELSPGQREFYHTRMGGMVLAIQDAHRHPDMGALDVAAGTSAQGPVPFEANYLYNDAAFNRVKRLVDSGRFTTSIGSIDDLRHLGTQWAEPDLPLAVDTSNVSGYVQLDQSLGLPPGMHERTRIIGSDRTHPGDGHSWQFYQFPAVAQTAWNDLVVRQAEQFSTVLGKQPQKRGPNWMVQDHLGAWPRRAPTMKANLHGSVPVPVDGTSFPANSPQVCIAWLAHAKAQKAPTASSPQHGATFAASLSGVSGLHPHSGDALRLEFPDQTARDNFCHAYGESDCHLPAHTSNQVLIPLGGPCHREPLGQIGADGLAACVWMTTPDIPMSAVRSILGLPETERATEFNLQPNSRMSWPLAQTTLPATGHHEAATPGRQGLHWRTLVAQTVHPRDLGAQPKQHGVGL